MILMRDEWFLGFSGVTCVVFLLYGETLFARLAEPAWLALIFLWLFTAMLGSALSVVRLAEQLAIRLGEPYGTLLLTLSVTFVEVTSIAAIMSHGANNPTLARDTMFAVAMIILNGMVGLSLLVGGWRHREQQYNLQGANAYLGVIIPLAVLSLVMPDFTQTTPGPILSHILHGGRLKEARRSLARTRAESALPSGLAQSLDQVGMVFWPKPRHTVSDIHVECGRRERDGLIQRFLCFRSPTELTKRGGRPAIDHRKIGVRPDQLFCRLDRLLVFSGEIKTAGNVQQTYRRKRIARIEPNTRLDRREPLLRPSRED